MLNSLYLIIYTMKETSSISVFNGGEDKRDSFEKQYSICYFFGLVLIEFWLYES